MAKSTADKLNEYGEALKKWIRQCESAKNHKKPMPTMPIPANFELQENDQWTIKVREQIIKPKTKIPTRKK